MNETNEMLNMFLDAAIRLVELCSTYDEVLAEFKKWRKEQDKVL